MDWIRLTLEKKTIHILDPVDVISFDWDVFQKMDAVLVQTSLAAQDFLSHPARPKNVQVYWLPHHHSNFNGIVTDPLKKNRRTVGIHTSHLDTELFNKLNSTHGEDFQLIDPVGQFYETGGTLLNPQQTDAVYTSKQDFDVTVYRQFNCMKEIVECEEEEEEKALCPSSVVAAERVRKYMCLRYRTAQRFLNDLAQGLPSVAWPDQGVLDIVDQDLYPLLTQDMDEAVMLLDEVLANDDFYITLREYGLRAADAFTLEKISWRLGLILTDLVGKLIVTPDGK